MLSWTSPYGYGWLFVSKQQSQKPWLTFTVTTYTRPLYYVGTTAQHPLCAERALSKVYNKRQEWTVGKISARKICNLWSKWDNKSMPSTWKDCFLKILAIHGYTAPAWYSPGKAIGEPVPFQTAMFSQIIFNCRNKATISYSHNMCTGRRVRVACSVELYHTGMEMSSCVKAMCSLMAKWLTRLIYSWYTGGWFNIKMPSYQYRKSHCGDKMIFRPSYLHNGISYTGKTTSLYWIRTLVPSHFTRELVEDSCHSGTDGLLYIGWLYGD